MGTTLCKPVVTYAEVIQRGTTKKFVNMFCNILVPFEHSHAFTDFICTAPADLVVRFDAEFCRISQNKPHISKGIYHISDLILIF